MQKIPLTQGKFALVDDADYEWLSKWKWWARMNRSKRFYAARHRKHRAIYMHREIMKPPKGMQVDHINHDTLDNRRCNLRICTHTQNMQNKKSYKGSSSKYKGVSWDKEHKNYRADITYKGKRIHLGHYTNEKDAARAYDNKAIELFGAFAKLNLPRRIPRK